MVYMSLLILSSGLEIIHPDGLSPTGNGTGGSLKRVYSDTQMVCVRETRLKRALAGPEP